MISLDQGNPHEYSFKMKGKIALHDGGIEYWILHTTVGSSGPLQNGRSWCRIKSTMTSATQSREMGALMPTRDLRGGFLHAPYMSWYFYCVLKYFILKRYGLWHQKIWPRFPRPWTGPSISQRLTCKMWMTISSSQVCCCDQARESILEFLNHVINVIHGHDNGSAIVSCLTR